MNRLTWTKRYSYGEYHYGAINGVRLFTVAYASMTKDYDGPRWKLTTELPGVTFEQRNLHTTVEQAKDQAELLLDSWLKRIGVVRA